MSARFRKLFGDSDDEEDAPRPVPSLPRPDRKQPQHKRLSEADARALAELPTATVCEGWSKVTPLDISTEGCNKDPVRHFAHHLGSMCARAVVVTVDSRVTSGPEPLEKLRKYVGDVPGSKIVVVQEAAGSDPAASLWSEELAVSLQGVGCVGTITDGAVRDAGRLGAVGFHPVGRRRSCAPLTATPVRFGGTATVFGRSVAEGQLVHADETGFLAVPPEDEAELRRASSMCKQLSDTVTLPTARGCAGKKGQELQTQLAKLRDAETSVADQMTTAFGACRHRRL
eukprot:TRINITY_DN3787_c1_g5_i2.p1 TRINITY_DN3787_c1_g5~~TRINITY_DN3787_c1_g5_i2.p1  ORF type:complete len:304 (+),score=89.82 TRINITY_DN3787_c1_g5_i2:59-913(+)